MVSDSHHILVTWRNHFFQLFSVHGISDVGQSEIHTAQPTVPELSDFEVEMAIGMKVTSPGTDQIPAELIKAGV